jgi:hypothetical protein
MSDNIVETLTAVVADKSQPAAERQRAAVALKFYFAKEQEPVNNLSDTDPRSRAIARMLAECDTGILWRSPKENTIEVVTGEDGVIRQRVIKIKRAAPQDDEISVPAPVHSTPVILPSPIPPSSLEQKAVELSNSRFTPEKVEAKIAAIQAVEYSKPLTTVEQVDAEMASRADLQRRIAENEKLLASLRQQAEQLAEQQK